MPVPRELYETTGRTNQKHRTRAALIAAARDLIAQGAVPTVENTAAAAAISRTTAYRYFPTQHALLAAAHPETTLQSLLPRNPPLDPARRLHLVVRAYRKILLDPERQQRTILRLSLDPSTDPADLVLRQGRVIGWLE